MEIVTQPEIDCPKEALAFLTSLKQILIYGNVSDADLENGQMRLRLQRVRSAGTQAEPVPKIEIK